ncbi:MAG: chromosome partitioning protein ParB [SAR86 cluster bacterium]|uniref:Probable chromosome-partitioning protein ParB n=1 Tax=SAR86 cluster bacterium TaxID=2030880 RepID=A0A2A4MRG2_9GAMM|nr:MAG: chromosome partitioning protein ParB [SAR86 cluster bacterium]
MSKKKLGKGLGALLAGSNSQSMSNLLGKTQSQTSVNTDPVEKFGDKDGDLKKIPIDLIQRGKYQPRTDMHEAALEELASSIRQQGVMQPIVVRPISATHYEIIAGERRWRATQIAGLDTIPAIIKKVGDESAIAMSLIENIQREDLNPMEEALALKRLQDEFELTQQAVADAVGKSRATVSNLMRLIGLSPEVRTMLEHGDLEMGHARALLSLDDNQQTQTARSVAGKGLSVRQTESLVRRLLAGADQTKSKPIIDPDINKLEEDLSGKLGAKVLIQHTAKGKGKLIFKYNSLDELEGILSHIK